MSRETKKDGVNVKELTRLTQSYIKKHPDCEDGYQMEALVYKNLGMADKQREILEQALQQSFAAPRCAIMLADMQFREKLYDKSLKNFEKALAEKDGTDTAVHDGYLRAMTALCKMASAKQHNVNLDKKQVLDIYDDLNAALSYADNLNANYKDTLAKKTAYLLEKYNVEIPKRNSELKKFAEELKS